MPSDELIGPVRAHLGLGTTVAAGKTGTAQLRARMVVSEVAGLTAWLYADLDDRANARRHYQRAVTEAEQSGHELLAIYMRASMGQFAVTSGDPAAGVSLIRQAKRGLSSSAPQVAAIWLDTLEASALAELRDSAALRLLGSVERRLERAEPEAAWPWLFRFDLGKVARYRAVAAARLGEAVQSERAFMECWPLLTAPKQRALMQIERADTLIALGQTDLAVSHAVEAFDAARAYGSHRALHAVAALRRKLPARPPVAVAELDGRLRSMYESAR